MNKKEIQQVSVKYIKGGKEIVFYNQSNGNCWIEKTVGDKQTIIKEFKIIK